MSEKPTPTEHEVAGQEALSQQPSVEVNLADESDLGTTQSSGQTSSKPALTEPEGSGGVSGGRSEATGSITLAEAIRSYNGPFWFLERVEEKVQQMGGEWPNVLRSFLAGNYAAEVYSKTYKAVVDTEKTWQSTEELSSKVDDWRPLPIKVRKLLASVSPNLPIQVLLSRAFDRKSSVRTKGQVTEVLLQVVDDELQAITQEHGEENDSIRDLVRKTIVLFRVRNVVGNQRNKVLESIQRLLPESKTEVLENKLKLLLRNTALIDSLNLHIRSFVGDLSEKIMTRNQDKFNEWQELSGLEEDDFYEQVHKVLDALGSTTCDPHRAARERRRKRCLTPGKNTAFKNFVSSVMKHLLSGDIAEAQLAVARRMLSYPDSFNVPIRSLYAAEIAVLQEEKEKNIQHPSAVRKWLAAETERRNNAIAEQANMFSVGQNIKFLRRKTGEIVEGVVKEISERPLQARYKVLQNEEGAMQLVRVVGGFVEPPVGWQVRVEITNSQSYTTSRWHYPGFLLKAMEEAAQQAVEEEA